jgi:hypothetical protein
LFFKQCCSIEAIYVCVAIVFQKEENINYSLGTLFKFKYLVLAMA